MRSAGRFFCGGSASKGQGRATWAVRLSEYLRVETRPIRSTVESDCTTRFIRSWLMVNGIALIGHSSQWLDSSTSNSPTVETKDCSSESAQRKPQIETQAANSQTKQSGSSALITCSTFVCGRTMAEL